MSIIGIHPLKNGLFRISLNPSAQRYARPSLVIRRNGSLFRMQSACASIPLIDGMVLPLHILSFFLRQSVHNLSRRKRLDDSQRYVHRALRVHPRPPSPCSSSQTAYSLRKNRITRIIDKYQHPSDSLDDFFQSIFFSSPAQSTLTPLAIVTVQS